MRIAAVPLALLGLALISTACAGRHLHTYSTPTPQTSINYYGNYSLIPGYTNSSDLPGAVDWPLDSPLLAKKVTGLTPEQVHITYWAPGQVLVSWSSGDAQVGVGLTPPDASLQQSIVQYGTESGNYTYNASGEAVTYAYNYSGFTGYNLLDYASATIHHVLLKDLQPGTKYYYRVADPKHWAYSPEHHFTLKTQFPIRISTIADSGQTPNTSVVIATILNSNPDYLFYIGDLSYADNYVSNGSLQSWLAPETTGVLTQYNLPPETAESTTTYQPRFDTWQRLWEPVLANIPASFAQGNHEFDIQADWNMFAAYNARFPQPQDPSVINTAPNNYLNPKVTNNQWSSVDIPGVAHAIFLTSYVTNDTFNASTAQYKWLEQDLKKVNRTNTPWLFVNWHDPWYSTSDSFKENECMRQGYEELFYTYGVDVAFNGHVHAYERTKAVYNYQPDDCGTIHIIVGTGGNNELISFPWIDQNYPNTSYCADPESRVFPDYQPGRCFHYEPEQYPGTKGYCYTKQPEWSAFRDAGFGAGLLTIYDETHALWQFFGNKQGDCKALDEVMLVRTPDKCKNKS